MATLVSARARITLGLGAALLPLFSIGRAAGPQFSFRLDHPLTAADAVQTAMLSLADNLKTHSDGRI